MFSADITWSPMVDEVSVESRKQPRNVQQRTDTPPSTQSSTLGRKGQTGRAESIKSASSGRSRFLRWGTSKFQPTLQSKKHDDNVKAKQSTEALESDLHVQGLAEMSEDRGPTRYELPLSGVERPKISRKPLSQPEQSGHNTIPTMSGQYTSSHLLSRPLEEETFQYLPYRSLDLVHSTSSHDEMTNFSHSPGSLMATTHSPSISSAPELVRTQTSPLRTEQASKKSQPVSVLESQRSFPEQRLYPQRLIRRMTNASSETRLARIQEDWMEPLNAEDRAEIQLEKELWLFNELFIQEAGPQAHTRKGLTSSGWVMPMPAVRRSGRILDIASRHSEIHQLAALQPSARIAHLVLPGEQVCYQTPENVACLPLSISTPLALDLADSSFDHVKLVTAVGRFTSPQLKALLQEAYRVLTVRGILEARWIDLNPLHAGPKTMEWISSTLVVQLDSAFLCTRPAVMVPIWAKEAGFEIISRQIENTGKGESRNTLEWGEKELVVCEHNYEASVEEKLESQLCRFLLKKQYSSMIRWFWEDEEIRRECAEMKTKFRICNLYGFKN